MLNALAARMNMPPMTARPISTSAPAGVTPPAMQPPAANVPTMSVPAGAPGMPGPVMAPPQNALLARMGPQYPVAPQPGMQRPPINMQPGPMQPGMRPDLTQPGNLAGAMNSLRARLNY